MTIQVDDSGWGDAIGGVVVSCFRVETGQFTHREVDVKFFQENLFDRKLYLPEISRRVLDMFDKLKVTEDERVEICTGYCLLQTRLDLMRLGYNVVETKITGLAQQLGERAFLDSLKKLGYQPIEERETNRRMRARSFYDMLKWLDDKPERLVHAKTGWKFFKNRKRGI